MYLYCLAIFITNHRIANKRIKAALEITALLFLGFVAGFADLLQISDMQIYQKTYSVVPVLQKFHFSDIYQIYGTFNMEKGFLFLIAALKTFHISFRGFLILHTVFCLSAFYYGLKQLTDDFAIVILFILYKIYFYNLFISMRQSITIAIFCLIVRYIYEGKKWRYWIGCIIAFSIHHAAVILFPLYFVRFFKINKRRMIVCSVAMGLVSLLIDIRLIVAKLVIYIPNIIAQKKIMNYLNCEDSLNLFHIIEFFAIMILVAVFYEHWVQDDEKAEMIMKLMMVLLLILTVGRRFSIVTRLKDYFTIFYGIIFSWAYKLENRKNRVMIFIFAVLLCFYGYLRYILSFGDGHSLLPYKNVIFEMLGLG